VCVCLTCAAQLAHYFPQIHVHRLEHQTQVVCVVEVTLHLDTELLALRVFRRDVLRQTRGVRMLTVTIIRDERADSRAEVSVDNSAITV
jgi:hypothetical protein